MGLIIRPKSKLMALSCRILTWANLKAAYNGEPIVVEWKNLSHIYIPAPGKKDRYSVFFSLDGLDTSISFYPDEVHNHSELIDFAQKNPQKILPSKFAVLKARGSFKQNLKYGFLEKYLLITLAFTFMFYQIKYFGSLMIQKYQFLIKTSCNQYCAEILWSTSVWWFDTLFFFIVPCLPIFFYKQFYRIALKSKNIHTINVTMVSVFFIGAFNLCTLIYESPTLLTAATKYSNIISAYSDGTLEAKISQKVEMASKRVFQGDVEDTEEVEVLEDQHEE